MKLIKKTHGVFEFQKKKSVFLIVLLGHSIIIKPVIFLKIDFFFHRPCNVVLSKIGQIVNMLS